MIRVWFDFPQDERVSVEAEVDVVPRVDEWVGITLSAPPNESYRRLDQVLSVRHYPRAVSWGEDAGRSEIRVLLGCASV